MSDKSAEIIRIIRSQVAKSNPSQVDIFILKTVLSRSTIVSEKIQIVELFLKKQPLPNLSVLYPELSSILAQTTLEQYHAFLKILIETSAKPSLRRNIKYLEYLIVKLYKSAPTKPVSLTALSLYCDLSLKLLDNKYFDRFKELSELEMSKH